MKARGGTFAREAGDVRARRRTRSAERPTRERKERGDIAQTATRHYVVGLIFLREGRSLSSDIPDLSPTKLGRQLSRKGRVLKQGVIRRIDICKTPKCCF
jgi:hypothetical protein